MCQAPGEVGKDFRGDWGQLIVGHVNPPKDFAGQNNNSENQNTHLMKPEGVEGGESKRERSEKVAGQVYALDPGGGQYIIIHDMWYIIYDIWFSDNSEKVAREV